MARRKLVPSLILGLLLVASAGLSAAVDPAWTRPFPPFRIAGNLYYVVIYTMWLKRITPLNIVIGGAAGALPPVIGWAAAANSLSAGPIAMFLIIFLWTPPHFWALALCRSADYERVSVPMLPNVAGPAATCRQILVYSVLLVAASFGPLVIAGVGLFYGLITAACDAGFLWRAFTLYRLRGGEEAPRRKAAMALFGFSIIYLFVLFAAMLAQVNLR